jgi:hypothetical protein
VHAKPRSNPSATLLPVNVVASMRTGDTAAARPQVTAKYSATCLFFPWTSLQA